jgi:hypothetical protein
MRLASLVKVGICLVVIALVMPALRAQAPANETATQFYTRYLAALGKATTIDQLTPLLSADMVKQITSTPADQRPMMFGMIKDMAGMNKNVKVTKETPNAKGTTLTATATGMDGKPVKGTIEVMKEGGAWKLGKESWSN